MENINYILSEYVLPGTWIFIIIGLLVLPMYISTIVILWPRLIAKYFFKYDLKRNKVNNMKNVLIFFQFSLFLLSYFYFNKFIKSVFDTKEPVILITASIVAVIVFFASFLLEDYNFFLSPKILNREMPTAFAQKLHYFEIAFITFFLILGNVVGFVFLIISLLVCLFLRQLIPKEEEKERINKYIEDLKSDNQNLRIIAAIILGDIGDQRGLAPLKRLINKDPRLREHIFAIQSISRINAPIEQIIHFLPTIFEQPEWDECMNEAVTSLSKTAGNNQKELIKYLSHNNRNVRLGVSRALRESGWEPKNEVEKMYFFAGLGEWKKLLEFGSKAKEPLRLNLKGADKITRNDINKTLKKIEEIERSVEGYGEKVLNTTRLCPYCSESIAITDNKCKYCGEIVND